MSAYPADHPLRLAMDEIDAHVQATEFVARRGDPLDSQELLVQILSHQQLLAMAIRDLMGPPD